MLLVWMGLGKASVAWKRSLAVPHPSSPWCWVRVAEEAPPRTAQQQGAEACSLGS